MFDAAVIEAMIDKGLQLQGLANRAPNQKTGASESIIRRNKSIVRWYTETTVPLTEIANRFGITLTNASQIIAKSGVPRRRKRKKKPPKQDSLGGGNTQS